ncbi:hypothetical protein ABT404_33525 [Streptomyces hyaluromycini]|uniref:Uncharacterized protein n=1 Tax=Streptomyces hyaluromycini TaxID=1377993 RepID=A0ABV1X5P2_9ACTN|nr:hypothetical protein [Streptomyces sp. GbtcB6]
MKRQIQRATPSWRREWGIAMLCAFPTAVAVEPLWHLLTYALHTYGLVWPWEFYLPLH